jgi:hypothetical protein
LKRLPRRKSSVSWKAIKKNKLGRGQSNLPFLFAVGGLLWYNYRDIVCNPKGIEKRIGECIWTEDIITEYLVCGKGPVPQI